MPAGARARDDLETVGGTRYRRLYEALSWQASSRSRSGVVSGRGGVVALSGRAVHRAARGRGIDVTFSPFLDAALFDALYKPGRLLRSLPRVAHRPPFRRVRSRRAADVVFIQREAMLFGPPVVEWLVARVLRSRMILDLDDAR